MTTHVAHRRQYQRRSVDIRGQVVIGEGQARQVSPLSGLSIPAHIKNISAGGALVILPVFLPRAAQVELEIPPGGEIPAGRLRARVTKVQMVDREPRYGIGLSFDDSDCPTVRFLRTWAQQETEA